MAKQYCKPETLREWLDRQGKDKTQQWLAEQLSVSAPYVNQILSGHRSPSLNVAARIEKLTGIPASSFAEVA